MSHPGRELAMVVLGMAVLAILAATAPVPLTTVAVILFAGPHNALELRYALSRLPRRFGPLARFFGLAAAGISLLSIAMIGLLLVTRFHGLARSSLTIVLSLWLTLLVVWTGATAGYLPAGDLTPRVLARSGASFWTEIPPATLLAIHGFLEALHYLAWLVAIPHVQRHRASIPLRGRSSTASRMVTVMLAFSIVAVFILWSGFALDPALTWDLYFPLATAHVLAEVPMLLRLL